MWFSFHRSGVRLVAHMQPKRRWMHVWRVGGASCRISLGTPVGQCDLPLGSVSRHSWKVCGFSIALWSLGFILGVLVSRVNLSGAPGRLKG